MDPKHDFTHELYQRGKQERAGILLLGRAGKEGIKAWRIQKPLQDRPSHHTDGALLDEGGKIVSGNMGVTSKRDAGALSNEMTM